jgi:subtilisin family serine protease
MSPKLLRYITIMAASVMTFTLAISASAQYKIERATNPEAIAQISTVPESPNGIYVVQMADDPIVAYDGSIPRFKATKPAKGEKIDPNSKEVVNYRKHLKWKHAKAVSKVPGSKKVYDYHYSFNGFAAKMSQAQAQKMQSVEGVVRVYADELRSLDTATTPDFLELTAPGGLYDMGVKGEDVIIGIVDGGVWPESLSFSDRTGTNGNGTKDGKLDYQQIPGWHGKCVPGERFNASKCNQKLIGARYYNVGWGGNAGINANLPWEFNSPRDFGGHGTHTSSTAGGNADVPMTGAEAFFGNANGIAPRARIAAYKVCWETGEGGSCYSVDSIAAIDQAVADGVDVINYSISGSRTNFFDPVEVAFLYAADAGVFVAASAGNSGSTASTVAHPGPWLTTVAASTHDRNYDAQVMLGNGAPYTGASTNTTGAGPADLVYSADVVLAGQDPYEGRLCYPGTLDSALVTGKIVLCDRGDIARVDKSLAVFMAGGIGSILANPVAGQTLNADSHSVPTVHVDNVAGDAIRAYATAGGTPTAEIFPSYFSPVPAPAIAGFSSRGPLLAGNGDLLKPDVSAPGVDILAAVAPPGNGGQDFASYQGTSMSSPHVAGLAALLTEMHPDWSPMMIKSALMTTGYDLISGADPFAQGAGHVDPNKAGDPGLVFDHGFGDWLDLYFGGSPTDVNGASIAIGSLLGSQSVTRTVTSVGDISETYDFSASVPGISVTASPSSFTIAPGASQTVEMTLTVDGATLNTYTSGFAYWTGNNGHVVRIPVVVKPAQVDADEEVDGIVDGAGDGSVDVSVEFGYTGTYAASMGGMQEGLSIPGTVFSDPGLDVWVIDNLPPNIHFRLQTFNADTTTPGEDDLDLRLFYGPNGCGSISAQLGGSGGATSDEIIDVSNGPAGCYWLVVDYYAAAVGDSIDYLLWALPVFGDNGNTAVTAPGGAVAGTTETVTVDYFGLNLGSRYLGVLQHADGGGEIARSIIAVDTQ